MEKITNNVLKLCYLQDQLYLEVMKSSKDFDLEKVNSLRQSIKQLLYK